MPSSPTSTWLMVLHDINEAARASDHLVAMRDGRIIHEGPPSEVINPDVLRETYGVECDVYPHPVLSYPYCVPRSDQVQVCDTVAPQGDGFQVNGINTGYGKHIVLENLSVEIEAGRVTSIIGPNACGKSTLVRTCARMLKPNKGHVHLGDNHVHRGSHRKFARRLALLAQGQMPPSGFLVEDLVASGRIPHQGLFRQWSSEDEAIVNEALERANLTDMRFREVDTLSGGQRQRCWFAMCLAQNTPVILLDEPTTFLDISAQLDMLDMAHRLNREEGRTVVMILHDLNMAARYSDTIIAMKNGRVMATGTPHEVLTPEILRDVFEIEAQVTVDRSTGCPVVIPIDSINTASEIEQIPAFEGLATAAIPAD